MLAPVDVLDPLPPSVSVAAAARHREAQQTVDALFAKLRQRNGDLEERRREQGERFLQAQQDRYKVLLQWQQLHKDRALYEEERERMQEAASARWSAVTDAGRSRVHLNVGGQRFEVAAASLRAADDASLLRALASSSPPVAADDSGAFFFDRDWWQFRLVLQFLREGEPSLPPEPAVLKQLYKEAAFWRLPSLQEAVRVKYQAVAGAGVPGPRACVADAVVAHKEWDASTGRALMQSAAAARRLAPPAGTAELDAATSVWRDPVYGGTYVVPQRVHGNRVPAVGGVGTAAAGATAASGTWPALGSTVGHPLDASMRRSMRYPPPAGLAPPLHAPAGHYARAVLPAAGQAFTGRR